MLSDDDLLWLTRQIAATAELLGQEIKPNAAALMADDLSAFNRSTLEAALHRVRTEHTGRLTPKAILDRIDELTGRLPANEAWAVACTALDERVTIVWTNEMQAAWSTAAPLAKAGDMVGARMAFIAAYDRIVRTAREARAVPVVSISEGWDTEQRNAAVEKALSLGYITPAQASAHTRPALPAPVINPIALLAGKDQGTHDAPPELRARLDALRAEFAGKAEAEAKARAERADRERRYLAARKAQVQAMVDAKLRGEKP